MGLDTILVTGGAGFIGANFIMYMCGLDSNLDVVNLDKLSYAGSSHTLKFLDKHTPHIFVKGDIGDRSLVNKLLREYKPHAIINFAAETHVDRSIFYPGHFIQSNIMDLSNLLSESVLYWQELVGGAKENFRFLHISTDEVYGSLDEDSPPSSEDSLCLPNSPYAASKASSDFFVRAFHKTYGLPVIITRSVNNYGPFQHPEKLIPLVIYRALKGENIPVYGDGKNRRTWIDVREHCRALNQILLKGSIGEIYNISSGEEMTNISLIKKICSILDEQINNSLHVPHEQLISFVGDRPGHDFRYALNVDKIEGGIGWKCERRMNSSLKETVSWYVNNLDWLDDISSSHEFHRWMDKQYKGKI